MSFFRRSFIFYPLLSLSLCSWACLGRSSFPAFYSLIVVDSSDVRARSARLERETERAAKFFRVAGQKSGQGWERLTRASRFRGF